MNIGAYMWAPFTAKSIVRFIIDYTYSMFAGITAHFNEPMRSHRRCRQQRHSFVHSFILGVHPFDDGSEINIIISLVLLYIYFSIDHVDQVRFENKNLFICIYKLNEADVSSTSQFCYIFLPLHIIWPLDVARPHTMYRWTESLHLKLNIYCLFPVLSSSAVLIVDFVRRSSKVAELCVSSWGLEWLEKCEMATGNCRLDLFLFFFFFF